jgi:hypothetical protein
MYFIIKMNSFLQGKPVSLFVCFNMYSLGTMKIPSPFLIPGACSTFGWLNFIPDCNQGFESEIIDAKEGTRKKKSDPTAPGSQDRN